MTILPGAFDSEAIERFLMRVGVFLVDFISVERKDLVAFDHLISLQPTIRGLALTCDTILSMRTKAIVTGYILSILLSSLDEFVILFLLISG